MRLYLIGFMASGKSWLGKELALASGLDFIDTDELFEERYRITILDFFSKYSEGLFRAFEQEILRETASLENTIISTGGGIPCFFDNMDFILASGQSIYLRMQAHELVTRIKGIKKQRPLLKEIDPSNMESAITNKLKEREPYYLRANYVFDGPDYPLEEILSMLQLNRK
ncbi:shikimate kinase [Bacteroidota bacterium]